jgi:hypothetical protein
MNGIENQKFQPIIRQVQNIQIAITPYVMTPLNAVTKPFLSQMIEFNDYQEQQMSQQHQIIQSQQKKQTQSSHSRQGGGTINTSGTQYSNNQDFTSNKVLMSRSQKDQDEKKKLFHDGEAKTDTD